MKNQTSTLVQTAYQHILDKILTFEWKPGAVVSDFQISRELDMSRTPVREAIQRLMHETLVEAAEHNKILVSPITAEDIAQVMEVRTALEQQAIRAIVTRHPMGPEQVAHLRQLNLAIQKTLAEKNFTENFYLEELFHTAIVEAAQNKRLLMIYRQLHLLILRARWLSLFDPHYEITVEQHTVLIDGLEAADLEKATAALELHMESAQFHFTRVFNDPAIKQAAQTVASLK